MQGKTVGLDTAPLIYFIEENPAYMETVLLFFEAMDKDNFLPMISDCLKLHPYRFSPLTHLSKKQVIRGGRC
jgi:hypothetical protein